MEEIQSERKGFTICIYYGIVNVTIDWGYTFVKELNENDSIWDKWIVFRDARYRAFSHLGTAIGINFTHPKKLQKLKRKLDKKIASSLRRKLRKKYRNLRKRMIVGDYYPEFKYSECSELIDELLKRAEKAILENTKC